MNVIYVRQSLDRDGTGAAVDRQLAECRDLAQRHGIQITHEYVDNDVSATKGIRPAFNEMLTGIKAGHVSTIVVWHTDRLYRRVRDLVEIVEAAEKHSLKVLTVRAGDLDLSTPAGRMLAGMLGHAARYEVEQKGARQVAANMQRAKAGVWQFSNRPYGYERVNGRVQVVAPEADIIREAYERYLKGETYYAIVDDFNERGIPTITGGKWSMTQLRARLRNPAYAGILMYKGEPVGNGDWEPIIDRQTWQRFESARLRRRVRHGWSNKTKYLLSGYARCGVCDGRLLARPEYKAGKDPRMVYSCTSGWCVSRDLRQMDALVTAAILGRLSRADAAELLKDDIDVQPLLAEIDVLQRRRDDLAALLADGTLTASAVRDASVDLGVRIDALQRRVAAAEGDAQLSALVTADDAAAKWETLTFRQKRAILEALLTVTVNKQKSTRRFDPESVAILWKGER